MVDDPRLLVGPLALAASEGELLLEENGATRTLPEAVLAAIFARYGRPLDEVVAVTGELLSLGDSSLGAIAHRSPVDVIPNDHVVWVRPGQGTLAIPAPLFVAAARALSRQR